MIEYVLSVGSIMKKCFVFTYVLMLLFSWNTYAKELPYIYKGARPLGMGGAFIALSNDANALFYNPAGLADIKETQLSPVGIEIESDRGGYRFTDDVLKLNFDNSNKVAQFLQGHIGDFGHVAASFFPNYSSPDFAFGLIGSAKSNLQVRDRQFPKLVVDAIGDGGVCTGFAHSLLDNNLLVGANLKYLYRESLEHEYTISDMTTTGFKDRVRDDINHGSGLLLDLGMIYKIQGAQGRTDQGPLQLGISINNLIGSKLGKAEDIDPHVDLGVSKRIGNITLAADYVDIFGQLGEDQDVGKRIHLGLEYAATKILNLRTGIYQGYVTFGIGLNMKQLQIDMLTYSEEVGTNSGQQKDRRYMLSFGLGL
jgi:hypothetical protein